MPVTRAPAPTAPPLVRQRPHPPCSESLCLYHSHTRVPHRHTELCLHRQAVLLLRRCWSCGRRRSKACSRVGPSHGTVLVGERQHLIFCLTAPCFTHRHTARAATLSLHSPLQPTTTTASAWLVCPSSQHTRGAIPTRSQRAPQLGALHSQASAPAAAAGAAAASSWAQHAAAAAVQLCRLLLPCTSYGVRIQHTGCTWEGSIAANCGD